MANNNIDHEALRRRFNPDGSLLRRQQLRMLELLLEVDRICKRHDISYWLSSGTLIGALRHDGFIPWDDDLDIEMMRPDYLRLMEVLPAELPAHMALQTSDTDPAYFFCYAKVRDRRSFLEEQGGYDRACRERGVYIDIFPLERQRMWLHRLSEKAVGHIYKVWRTGSDDLRSLRTIRRWLGFNLWVVHPLLRLMCQLTRSRVITSGLGVPFHNPRYAEDIFPLTTHTFEGHQLPVPHDADHLLRGLYGDYMQLPDLDKAAASHVVKLSIDPSPAPSPREGRLNGK